MSCYCTKCVQVDAATKLNNKIIKSKWDSVDNHGHVLTLIQFGSNYFSIANFIPSLVSMIIIVSLGRYYWLWAVMCLFWLTGVSDYCLPVHISIFELSDFSNCKNDNKQIKHSSRLQNICSESCMWQHRCNRHIFPLHMIWNIFWFQMWTAVLLNQFSINKLEMQHMT